MECIGCAQCIDACDAVMDELAAATRPDRLHVHRTSSRGSRGGCCAPGRSIYPALLLVVAALFVGQVRARSEADVWILRQDAPFALLADGTVSTPVRVKIENRSDTLRTYRVRIDGMPGSRVIDPRGSFPVAPRDLGDRPAVRDLATRGLRPRTSRRPHRGHRRPRLEHDARAHVARTGGGAMSAGTRWILIVIGLLLGNAVAVVVLIGSAGGTRGRVLPDYYDRAAAWDDTMAETARSNALGWRGQTLAPWPRRRGHAARSGRGAADRRRGRRCTASRAATPTPSPTSRWRW